MRLPHPVMHSLRDVQDNFEALSGAYRPRWITPAFASGWSDYDPALPVGVAVAPSGLALTRGVATKSSAWRTGFPGELICTLPVGPGQRAPLARNVSAAFGVVDIYPNGEVRLVSGSAWVSTAASYVAFDGVSFWVEG